MQKVMSETRELDGQGQPGATDPDAADDEELIPPQEMIFVGGGDFREIGEAYKRVFIERCGLSPNGRILDVGCGIGRMAVPLTGYLNRAGRYEGFDIVADGINWCKNKITPRYPNFRFQLADLFNKWYNPGGQYKSSDYAFPYGDESFDLVSLTSVFTHMLPEDMANYFAEISRVLRNGGRCLITYFLLNEESSRLIDAGKSRLDFKYKCGEHCRGNNPDTVENVVAYDEHYIMGLCRRHGLTIQDPILYGSWCGRSKFWRFQDVVIARK